MSSTSHSDSSKPSLFGEGPTISASECPHIQLPPLKRHFNPQGDLILIVGANTCRIKPRSNPRKPSSHYHERAMEFIVDSALVIDNIPALKPLIQDSQKRLSLFSPDVLYPTVDLPDDNAPAMSIIFKILYGADGWPFTSPIDIDTLVQLTFLAEKYKLFDILQPWAHWWVENMEPNWKEWNRLASHHKNIVSTTELEKLTWIFWAFGDEPLYAHCIIQLAIHAQLDKNGAPADGGQVLYFTDPLGRTPKPPYALHEIASIRLEMLYTIRKMVRTVMSKHLHGSTKHVDGLSCGRADGHDDVPWRLSVLRLAVGMFHDSYLWPLPHSDEMTISVKSLILMFRRNPNIPSFYCGFGTGGGIRYCHPTSAFYLEVRDYTQGKFFQLAPESSVHLHKRARLSGLTEGGEDEDEGGRETQEAREVEETAWSLNQAELVHDLRAASRKMDFLMSPADVQALSECF
ncbi:hypothetical protein F5Y16DRAFT_399895 [Xylariaceae sp. FL0255]|nr:hypothetical protein F5Y16DRAFT_399895 [Xylariaceae sp. FL0255]